MIFSARLDRKPGPVACLLIFFSLLLCLGAQARASDDPLRYCYEERHYNPYTLGNDVVPSHSPGILVELVTDAMGRAGRTVEFYRRPWKRCIVDLQDGVADGIFPSIWAPERDRWGLFPKALKQGKLVIDPAFRLWQASYHIYSNVDRIPIWNGQQFSAVPLGIGTPLGYLAAKKLQDDGVFNRHVTDPYNAFHLLELNKLDGFVIDFQIGQRMVAEMNLVKKISHHREPYFNADWYLVFSRQRAQSEPDLPMQVWKQMAKIRAENKQKYLEAYVNMP
ncbi:amino acid ABC transporter periplasmic protein [Oleiphilus messinensis]|uniref:Amino acid ABC transporter periplasmic protein n=2 Tax=Oleiphilus messinensis TaxID=141451 RepID=A0A1Y0IFU9_9GAMM|nr:amino acid ABC transporter periplasmic protein [Oleiphilus messinensis]